MGKGLQLFIDRFLELYGDHAGLEGDIQNLRSVTNPKKFRIKAMLVSAVVFQRGFDAHKKRKRIRFAKGDGRDYCKTCGIRRITVGGRWKHRRSLVFAVIPTR